jgi:Nitronate monooxygenase
VAKALAQGTSQFALNDTKPMPVSFLGVDIICAQGGEGGGHTGDTAFSILIPAVVDLCNGAKSPLTGEPVIVVAAGGIADGRGLAAALSSVYPHYSVRHDNLHHNSDMGLLVFGSELAL